MSADRSSSYQSELYFNHDWNRAGASRFASFDEADAFAKNVAATWNPRGFVRDTRVRLVREPVNALLNRKTLDAEPLGNEVLEEEEAWDRAVLDDDGGEPALEEPSARIRLEHDEEFFRLRVERFRERLRQQEIELNEVSKVWDQTNIEARELVEQNRAQDRVRLARIELRRAKELGRLTRAQDLFDVAEGELRRAIERLNQERQRVEKEAVAVEAEERRLIRQAPPSLQQLVLAYGTYDKVPREAWAKFDAEMAEWKAKMRAGEFDAKIWR